MDCGVILRLLRPVLMIETFGGTLLGIRLSGNWNIARFSADPAFIILQSSVRTTIGVIGMECENKGRQSRQQTQYYSRHKLLPEIFQLPPND
jgi:hypothetical protein